MKLLIIAPDIPFPANRGGRADIWRRIQALNTFDCEIFLICFYDDNSIKRPSSRDYEFIQTKVSKLICLPIQKSFRQLLKRLFSIYRLPSHVSSRVIPPSEISQVLSNIEKFKPDAVLLEGPWGGEIAKISSAHFNIPLIYRSHNIEHLYMARQARVARSIRDKIVWSIACIKLKQYEYDLLKRAAIVFDISYQDIEYWQQRGIENIHWLPALSESALLTVEKTNITPNYDVVFLGNLTTPNNVRGVEWLINEILPKVLKVRPNTTFLVAGSNPGPYIKQLCAEHPTVTLVQNPPDAILVYRSGRVLVNPVRTGSGLHVKALEMLMMDVPIISSWQGTRGMPDSMKELFHVHDEAAGFAQAIVENLAAPLLNLNARIEARRLFSIEAIREMYRIIQSEI